MVKMFDPLSREFCENPYTFYEELREATEPVYFEAQNMWMLSRYEDVTKIAANTNMVRSLQGISSHSELMKSQQEANWHEMPYHEKVVQFSLLDSDGDIHRRLRKQVFGYFTGHAVAGLEPMVRQFVETLLDAQRGKDHFDFIADFAAHIPGYVIGKLLGAPKEDCLQLRLWSEQVVQFFDVDRSDEKKEIAETATREFYYYLEDLKQQRQAAPADDLISHMIRDEADGKYTQDEFISTCMLILMAGHGSTIDVLGSGMHTLINSPDAQSSLRDDPSKLPNGIQEMFRYEPPLPFFHRHALEDISVHGRNFPSGTTFGLLYGAANHDPRQFPEPDKFQIERNPNRHVAFGQGAHLCLGNHLARLNMKVIFETLLSRFAGFEQVDERVEYKRGLSVRGPKTLNIRCY